MKKQLLFMLMLLFLLPSMEAQRRQNKRAVDYEKYSKIQQIEFVENGVKFYVMPNGKFKFSKLNNHSFKYTHRKTWKYTRNLKVNRDKKGRITRVGNIKIHYKKGNIDRIGSVDFKYRKGQLKSVGKLHIIYKRNGEFTYIGSVKKIRPYYLGPKIYAFNYY